WTSAGISSLGKLAGSDGCATDLHSASADGTVAVGTCGGASFGPDQAFRWTEATGMVSLGGLAGKIRNAPLRVSSNGAGVIGWSTDANGTHSAFAWSASAGMEALLLPGDTSSLAREISADGTVAAGWSSGSAGSSQAFRWTEASGVIALGFLSGHDASKAD